MHFQDVGGTLVDVDSVVLVEKWSDLYNTDTAVLHLGGGSKVCVGLPAAEVRALVLARAKQREAEADSRPLTDEGLNNLFARAQVTGRGTDEVRWVLDRVAEASGLGVRFTMPSP